MRIILCLLSVQLSVLHGLASEYALAGEGDPSLPVGSQEVGLSVGYLLPHRLTDDHVTKQKGPAFMPSWGVVLTNPLGNAWYQGQVLLGAEVVYLIFTEPTVTHGIGFTPKIKYSFTKLKQIRPYLEFAGGPFWTDLSDRIPEQSSKFHFLLTAGVGIAWFVTSNKSLNAGYRFQHISNAGTSMPNLGLNASLPFIGFSIFF